jgi:ATP synthase protein I
MVPIFVCTAVGLWLDKKFGTWFTVPFLVLGIVAGGRNAYVLAISTVRQEEARRKREQDEQIRKVLEEANADKNDRQA